MIQHTYPAGGWCTGEPVADIPVTVKLDQSSTEEDMRQCGSTTTTQKITKPKQKILKYVKKNLIEKV